MTHPSHPQVIPIPELQVYFQTPEGGQVLATYRHVLDRPSYNIDYIRILYKADQVLLHAIVDYIPAPGQEFLIPEIHVPYNDLNTLGIQESMGCVAWSRRWQSLPDNMGVINHGQSDVGMVIRPPLGFKYDPDIKARDKLYPVIV